MKRSLYLLLFAFTFWHAPRELVAADVAEKTNQLVGQIHDVHVTEVALGQLAAQKGQTPSVKEYAQQMVTAHQEADQKLLEIAARDSLKAEPQSAESNGKYEKLTKTAGLDFDKSYLNCMVEGHEKLLKKIKNAQGWLPIASALAKYTQDLIPVVEHHLMLAKQIETDLKVAQK